jgi:hypothetical protein
VRGFDGGGFWSNNAQPLAAINNVQLHKASAMMDRPVRCEPWLLRMRNYFFLELENHFDG